MYLASSSVFDPYYTDVISTFVAGATLCFSSLSTTFAHFQECLSISKATHVLTTPALLGTITIPQANVKLFPDLECVASGGEPMSGNLILSWIPHVKLYNTYGVTECCAYQSACLLNDFISPQSLLSDKEDVNSVIAIIRKCLGVPLGTCGLHVMSLPPHLTSDISDTSPDEMIPTLIGEIGELWISGSQVGYGYLSSPGMTSKRFLNHKDFGRVYRTGDLVLRSEKYGLIYKGRCDSQVKIKGRRIELDEIDQKILDRTPRSLLSSVVTVLHSDLKTLITFGIVGKSLQTEIEKFEKESHVLDQTSLSDRSYSLIERLLYHICLMCLPPHMIPSRFIFVSSFPLSPTGKIDRKSLSTSSIPPRLFSFEMSNFDNPIEELNEEENEEKSNVSLQEDVTGGWIHVVRCEWAFFLNLNSNLLRNHTSFTEIGGDSLKALEICRSLFGKFQKSKGLDESLSGKEKIEKLSRDFSKSSKHDEKKEKKRQNERNDKKKDDGEDDVFGDLLGFFAPMELLKRPSLLEYSLFLFNSVGSVPPQLLEEYNVTPLIQLSKGKKSEKASDVLTFQTFDPFTSLLYEASAIGFSQFLLILLTDPFNVSPNCETKSSNPNQKEGMDIRKMTTPLHISCLNGHLDSTSILIQNGAVVTALDPSGATVIHLAAQKGTVPLLALLLKSFGWNSESHRNAKSKGKVKKDMSRKGASEKSIGNPFLSRDDNGQVPLHHAARSGASKTVISFLIDQCPNSLGIQDKWGRTSLHWAAVNGHGEAVRALMEMGSDPTLPDLEGETPRDIAERRARCGASERGDGVRSSVFGDIAKTLGGSGTTKSVGRFKT